MEINSNLIIKGNENINKNPSEEIQNPMLDPNSEYNKLMEVTIKRQ